MSARFAGSQDRDERRRRRMASGPEDERGQTVSVLSRPTNSWKRVHSSIPDSPRLASDRFPLHKVISHRIWKNLLLAVLLGCCGGGLVWLGMLIDHGDVSLGKAGDRFFALRNGTALRSFGAGLLVCSAQLAYLIGWGRSRSPRDFAGRYRVWTWVASAWMLFAFCSATDAHIVASQMLFDHWQVNFWQQEVLGWLVPAYVVVLCLLWPLHRDMLDCRLGLVCLACSCIGALFFAVTSLNLVTGPRGLMPVIAPLATQYFIFLSMMLEARHVIHVSCDPPTRLRARTRVEPWWKRRRTLEEVEDETVAADQVALTTDATDSSKEVEPRSENLSKSEHRSPAPRKRGRTNTDTGHSEQSPVESSDDQNEASEAAGSPSDQSPVKESKRSFQAKPDIEVEDHHAEQSSPDDHASVTDPGDFEDEQSTRESTRSKRKSICHTRRDESEEPSEPHIDPSELRGLSKKQRRALRKQRREQARQSR